MRTVTESLRFQSDGRLKTIAVIVARPRIRIDLDDFKSDNRFTGHCRQMRCDGEHAIIEEKNQTYRGSSAAEGDRNGIQRQ